MNSAEFRIPKPFREIVATLIATAFVLFFVILGITNLVKGVAIIASSLWLLFIGFIMFAGFKEEGVHPLLLSMLRAFAHQQFMQVDAKESQPSQLRFGFRFLGLTFFYRSIPLAKIEGVYWSPGQGTHMAKRDMNDWSVVLWYDHDDPAKSQRQKRQRKPDQDLEIIGPSGRKEATAAFGRALVDFLGTAGAKLDETEPDRFTRPISSQIVQVDS